MLVQVNARGFELNDELRRYVEEKLTTALVRFSPRVASARAFLADENGPKRGRDKSLRVVIDIERLPLIVVEEKGEAWHAVLDASIDRAVHAVSRQVERVRSRVHRTSMAGDLDSSLGAGLA